MPKVMIFVDGSWLYHTLPKLGKAYGSEEYHIDFGKLPSVLAGCVAQEVGPSDFDIVRTYLFGSYASNTDPQDEEIAEKRLDFFDMLKEEYHYEIEIFPIDFKGHRIRRQDRAPNDDFEPKEKCVDIALASAMLYLAAIPYAYDIAVAVLGDRDYMPVLQHVRRLGKRVAISSAKGSCAPAYSDPLDKARVRDFDMIWLDDLLHVLQLRFESHRLECQSPSHKGERAVYTTFHPRKGQRFYCDECRKHFQREKHQAEKEYVASTRVGEKVSGEESGVGATLRGIISRKVEDRGFGFITVPDGRQFFFHLTDLVGEAAFKDLAQGMEVEFLLKRAPTKEKAGAAMKVRLWASPSDSPAAPANEQTS